MFKFIKNHDRVKVQTFLLCGIAVTLLFTLNLSNLSIMVAAAYNILFFKKENLKKIKSYTVIFPVLFFLATVVSGYYSKNVDEGLRSIDLYLVPILLVLVIVNSNLGRKVFIKVFDTFLYGSVLSASILIFNALYKLFTKTDTQEIVFHDFTQLYDQHPVYYAILLSVAIFYMTFVKHTHVHKILKFTGGAILVVSLILCASKIVLAVNAIAYVLILILGVKEPKQKFIYVIGALLVAITVFNVPFIKKRFLDGLRFHDTALNFSPTNNFKEKKLFDYGEKTRISDLELRSILWKIGTYHLMEDNKLFFGYGQGDVQDYLDYYYYSYNLAPHWNEGRNIHNQYLHILITNGLFILMLFLGYMGFSLYVALKSKDILHLFFISLIGFVFIFEVMLVRNMGINLFYFLNTFFLIKNIYFENSDLRNEGNSKLSWRI